MDRPGTARHLLAIAIAWAVIAGLLGGIQIARWNAAPLLDGPDSEMRMVMVTDLLSGQPWQDLSVMRDNTPYGGQMHWSRLVDAPIAALVLLAGPTAAAFIWPLLLLLPALWLVSAATRRLAPGAGVALVAALFALNFVTSADFKPGNVDHHNVQSVLVLGLLVALLLGRTRFWGGVAAGLCAATCLAIGLESIAVVFAGGLALWLCWLIDPAAHKAGLMGFGAALGGGALGHFVLATPPSLYFVPACDMLSVVYVTAAVLAGLALVVSAAASSRLPIAARLLVSVVLGGSAMAVVIKLYPHCLAGPYADVAPQVVEELFSRIGEVLPLPTVLAREPEVAWVLGGTVFLALGVAVWRAVASDGAGRQDWLILALMLLATIAVSLLEVRGIRVGAALAVPAGAWLVTATVARLRNRAVRVAGAAAAFVAFAPVVQDVAIAALPLTGTVEQASAGGPSPAACNFERDYAQLAGLSPARVAAPIAIATHILSFTQHSVLSAGFHRNGKSIIDAVDFFADETRARAIASERGLTLVATCGEDPEVAKRDWLEPLPVTGPVRLYRISLR